jgi:hypothetical protein
MKLHLTIESFEATLEIDEHDEVQPFDADHDVEACGAEGCVQCKAQELIEHRRLAEERQHIAERAQRGAEAEAKRWQGEFERVSKAKGGGS